MKDFGELNEIFTFCWLPMIIIMEIHKVSEIKILLIDSLATNILGIKNELTSEYNKIKDNINLNLNNQREWYHLLFLEKTDKQERANSSNIYV